MSHQICSRCIMDTTDPKITFDADGVCSHCHSYDAVEKTWPLKTYLAEDKISQVLEKVKTSKSGQYDSIVGLSGGVDSSYVAYLAHQHGLNPLCVHLDNGWNSELAVSNIHNIVKKLNFDLHTHVIDWNEFRSLQRAFFKAHVVDIEVLSDHAICAVIINLAKKHNIKYVLSGANFATEAVMPKSWVHRKQDLKNIRHINKLYGELPMKTFPQASTLRHVLLMYGLGYKVMKPLNYIDYNKKEAMQLLKDKFDWRPYGGKHYESLFTKFYQAHILPNKFNIDKRKAHLSTLVLSKQMTREEALEELSKPLYDPEELEQDKAYVLKKLGLTPEWFEDYMKAPPRSHYEFKSDEKTFQFLALIRDRFFGASVS